MADPNAGPRWRRDALLARGERHVLAAVRDALATLASYAQGALRESGLDPAVLDDRAPAWRDALTGQVNPAIAQVFADAWDAIAAPYGQLIDPTPYGTRHLESVWNRLVGSSDEVFDRIRTVLEAGRQEGLGIDAMAREVDALLGDTANWEGRARVIARTEVIGANNAGAQASARATADFLGVPQDQVQQSWLATNDSRTRETHAEADGQTVLGMDTPFIVGGYELSYPGDPAGPPEEVVSCRCTTTVVFPGDPGYDDSLTAGATMTHTGRTITEETPVDETITAGGTLLARRQGAARSAMARTVEDLVASGFFPSRQHAVDYLRRAVHAPIYNVSPEVRDGLLRAEQRAMDAFVAAAGEPAPVPVEPDDADLAVGDDAPALLIEPGNDWGPNPDRFHGICTVEDEQTGDGRVFAPGAIYWDESGLPMPLGWQVADAPGHDGSVICGRIDTFERVGNAITYTGTWDLDGAGWETRRLVQGQFLRGISVDTDDVDAVLVSPDGEPLDMFDMMMGGDEQPVALMQRSRLRSAALCRVPAFAPSGTEGAYIANGLPEDLVAAVDAGMEEPPPPSEDEVVEALVAAAVASDLPAQDVLLPPGDWFSDPGLTEPTAITVTDDGRVYGHLATWGTCHVAASDRCITPPRTATGYAHFAHGITMTSGGPVVTGVLTMNTGHAAPDLRALPAAAHYDDTGSQFASVAVGEDALGIWLAGALLPGVSDDTVRTIRAAGAVSGDWRKIRGNLELVAALAVNCPGFPVPRVSMAASATEGQTSLLAAGIVTPDVAAASALADGTLTMDDVRAMVASALSDERAAEARRGRIERASRTLRRSRATAAAARIGG